MTSTFFCSRDQLIKLGLSFMWLCKCRIQPTSTVLSMWNGVPLLIWPCRRGSSEGWTGCCRGAHWKDLGESRSHSARRLGICPPMFSPPLVAQSWYCISGPSVNFSRETITRESDIQTWEPSMHLGGLRMFWKDPCKVHQWSHWRIMTMLVFLKPYILLTLRCYQL